MDPETAAKYEKMNWGMKNIVISIFGSSIMEGRIGADTADERWYNILQGKLSERFPAICFPVVNGAVGGESTREVMRRFDRDALAYSPDYLLVMVGGNNNDYTKPERIVPLEEVKSLMEEMLRRAPVKTQVVAVVFGPVINEQHQCSKNTAYLAALKKMSIAGLNELLEPERKIFREFIKKYSLPSLDLYETFKDAPEKYILPDGVHLNKHGHAVFAEKMFEIMEKLISKKENIQ